ncbi:hypothetical protein LOZ54_006772, partial [Ophidiomyces ophidiicola]
MPVLLNCSSTQQSQNLLESFSESLGNISTESDSESDKSFCKEDLMASLQKHLTEKLSDAVYLSTLAHLYSDIPDLMTKIFQSLDIMCR